MKAVLCAGLLAVSFGLAPAAHAERLLTMKKERQAHFEATQATLNILACVVEAASADGDPNRIADVVVAFTSWSIPLVADDSGEWRMVDLRSPGWSPSPDPT